MPDVNPELLIKQEAILDGQILQAFFPTGALAQVQCAGRTIADVFNACTACKRPHQPGLHEEKALASLAGEAKAIKIDCRLHNVFIESGAWRLERRMSFMASALVYGIIPAANMRLHHFISGLAEGLRRLTNR